MSAITTSRMDVALEYATEHGWRVVPIPPGQKHPRFFEWGDKATTDVDQIEVWWKRFPNDGIGIATGPQSGLWVLDIDTKNGKDGDKTLADLEAVHGELPETRTVQSGSGGWHYYFRWDPNRPIDNGQNLLGPDIDCLADGAQVVAPPTPYPVTGIPYRVHLDVPLAETPQWIYDLLQARHVSADSEVGVPVAQAPTLLADPPQASSGIPSVWDDYNAHTTWDDILSADDWVKLPKQPSGRRAGETDWVRPGKKPKEGSSATVGHNGSDTLKVFTTSIPALTTHGKYTRFGYYAAMNHDGDIDAAAATLKADGFGSVVKWLEQGAQATAAASVTDGTTVTTTPTGATLLGLRRAGDIAAEVDAMPPRQWLFRRVWPSGDYGMLAAKHKAGKGWVAMSAAVAVAAGVPWLGKFEVDTTGTVLLFASEGGKAKITRRGRAVATDLGVVWDELPIMVSERAPHLTDQTHLAALDHAVAEHRPALIIIDPLYLSAGAAADGKNLYAMGAVLEAPQHIALKYGAALMVVHHHNRDSSRTGSDRMSGAGPAEWGRVLVSLNVTSDNRDTAAGRTDVHFNLDLDGDEIAGGQHSFRRQVWADDQDDIGAPLHCSITPVEGTPNVDTGPLAGMSPSARRVHTLLNATMSYADVGLIGDWLANDGKGPPLKVRTIQDACKTLTEKGLIHAAPTQAGGPGRWRRLGAEKVDIDVI